MPVPTRPYAPCRVCGPHTRPLPSSWAATEDGILPTSATARIAMALKRIARLHRNLLSRGCRKAATSTRTLRRRQIGSRKGPGEARNGSRTVPCRSCLGEIPDHVRSGVYDGRDSDGRAGHRPRRSPGAAREDALECRLSTRRTLEHTAQVHRRAGAQRSIGLAEGIHAWGRGPGSRRVVRSADGSCRPCRGIEAPHAARAVLRDGRT